MATGSSIMSLLQEPTITIEDVAIRGISLSHLDLDVCIRVMNPNFLGVTVREVTFQITLPQNGMAPLQIAQGIMGETKIPRKGSIDVTVPVSTSNSGLLSVILNLIGRGDLPVSVTGVAKIDAGITTWSFPFTKEITITPAMITGQQ